MSDLSNYRKTYQKGSLLETQIPANPIDLFNTWFADAEINETQEANAMTVSAISTDGFPKSRIVLLKYFDENSFIFYTNYESEKGKAILQNPNVCLSFFWPNMERQVIIKGKSTKTSPEISDNYFYSRPLGSQIGAIVSAQSEVIPSRDFLENKLSELEKLPKENIKRPENWGGFSVKPVSIEFWQGRDNRLHDRILFTKNANSAWNISRLSP
jgi:pyridoxamine 5'-phosphate oxidase